MVVSGGRIWVPKEPSTVPSAVPPVSIYYDAEAEDRKITFIVAGLLIFVILASAFVTLSLVTSLN